MYDVWRNQAASRMFNNLRLEIIESGYAKLDSVWCYHGVCSPFSRLYIVRAGDGIVHAANGQTARLLPGRFTTSRTAQAARCRSSATRAARR